MSENPAPFPTLLSVVSQWPVASNIAQHLPAGSLINLARSSTSFREILHGFGAPSTSEAHTHSSSGSRSRTLLQDANNKDVWPGNRVLDIGAHRTPYWEGLKRLAPFTCSSRSHTKGDKTRSCRYCSMPICESCVVKHSFGKNENTFKNRCRFMCQRCWDTGNVRKEQRYSGRVGGAGEDSYRSAAVTRQFCICTSKDGWVCNDCKEKQNMDAKVDGTKVCFGQNCALILGEDKDRRKICLWCDKPVPRGRASMESRIAFDHKISDARGREISSRLADLDEYERNRRRQMLMSRRELRGDEAVENDPDADVQQFLRNLDVFNYHGLVFCLDCLSGVQPSGDEVYASKHGRWKYSSHFLKCFMRKCRSHNNVAYLRSVTSLDPTDAPMPKTNMDLWTMKRRRKLDEQADMEQLGSSLHPSSNSGLHRLEAQLAEEQLPDAEENPDQSRDYDTEYEDQEVDNGTSQSPQGRKAQTRHDRSSSRPGVAEVQPGERPPEYGADTLVLESGDLMDSE
jgi:hypothetical protein